MAIDENNLGNFVIFRSKDMINAVGEISEDMVALILEKSGITDFSNVYIYDGLAYGENYLVNADAKVLLNDDKTIASVIGDDVDILITGKTAMRDNRIFVSQEVLQMQERLNKQLAEMFNKNGITNFRLTSLGNSISSGYSMTRTTMPLLLRNYTLDEVMKSHGIDLERHGFARAQNNNDEHVFEWIISNIKESEMHSINRSDYSDGPSSMVTRGLTEDKMNEYYPTSMENDFGLQDLIKESANNMANVVVYNGLTGSFLDNVTREGRIRDMFTFGIKRDTYGLEATLKFIQTNNRKNGGNTQVYLCGAPNILGIGITEIINKRLKKLASEYANVVYVEPIKTKFFYKPLDVSKEMTFEEAQNIIVEKLGMLDVHYDEEEYAQLNNHITQAITDNYEVTAALIDCDREMSEFSSKLELEHPELLDDDEYILNGAKEIIDRNKDKVGDKADEFLDKAGKYLLTRSPYDYFYVGKQNIKDATMSGKRI